MVEKKDVSVKNAKRLSKGQRTHLRRLKQAAGKEPIVVVRSPK